MLFAAWPSHRPHCLGNGGRPQGTDGGGHNLGLLASPPVGYGADPFSLIDAFILGGMRQG